MGLKINSGGNIIPNQLRTSQNQLRKTMERLATGNRINRAADDAAGLAIAEGLRAQLSGLEMESRNLQMGASLAQTAEGGLEQTSGALQRMRELALQASSGTLSDEQRAMINQEAQQLVEQVNDIAEDTQFNEINPLAGTETSVDLGAGTNIDIELPDATAAGLGIDTIDLSTQAGAEAALADIDAAMQTVNEQRGSIGATTNAIQSAVNTRNIEAENVMAAQAAIREADIAVEVSNLARTSILVQAGAAMMAQANILSRNAARLLGA